MIKSASKYADWDRHRRGKKNVGAYIDPELKKRLERKASQLDRSMAWIINQAITEYLAKK